MNKEFVKNYTADAQILGRRLVKIGAADGSVAAAAAATDNVIGVSDQTTTEAGEQCDVILAGIAEVSYGGTVTRGDLLVANASGQAVTQAAGAGNNVGVIGTAMVSGVSGDVGEVLISRGSLQG